MLRIWVAFCQVALQERLEASGTLDRFGTVEECASVAAFLVGPMADYVAGEVIKVNGASAKI